MATIEVLQNQAAIRSDLGAIFVALELSRKTWVVCSLSPGSGEKVSKHSLDAGDANALMARLNRLRERAQARTGRRYPIVVIQEAGLDGFWLHRFLERQEGVESWVVDPASIAVARRKRRAKSDRIDGERMLRALLAFKRGEPRVCAMVKPPTPEEEDARRIGRERAVLIGERVAHVNRIKGLLFAQGIFSYEPLRRDRRAKLETLRTGDGRALPEHVKAQIARELDRLELLLQQIKAVEKARDALVKKTEGARMLTQLRGIAEEIGFSLWSEGLYRGYANRRQLAAYAGLAPTPWQSGSVEREQGISKAGNPRLRSKLIELAWLWLKHQPNSALSRWFWERVGERKGRIRRVTIVALARKLLIALWKYLTLGEIPEGAMLKPA